jgi:hypothetical protein
MVMRKRDAYVDDDDVVRRDGESVRVPLHLMDGVQRAIAGRTLDARAHQPHYARLTDEQAHARGAARAAWIRQLGDAWKRDATPPQFTCPECHGTGRDPDSDSPDGRCDECGGSGYIDPPTNAARKQQHETFPMRRSPDTSLRADAAAARRSAHDAYCRRIQNAWRGTEVTSKLVIADAAEPDASVTLLGGHLSAEPAASAAALRESSYEEYKKRVANAWQQGRTDPGRASAIEQQRERWLGRS